MTDFSHINDDNQPGMVDVGGKDATRRTAHARSIVQLPHAVAELFDGDEIQSKKGPVFQTAIIAGTMGAKKTSELIPLCHPIGLDGCDITIRMEHDDKLVIDCTCSVAHKTGVEMEALTGATIAALTIYDMCKGISHDIVLGETMLMSKSGGRSDFQRDT